MQIIFDTNNCKTDAEFMRDLVNFYTAIEKIPTDDTSEELQEELIQELEFPEDANCEALVSENRYIFVGGGDSQLQSEWVQMLISKINSYKIVVIENGLICHISDWSSFGNVDAVIYSRDSAFEYLSKLDPNTYEKTLIILKGICDFELHYGELFYGLINRIKDCENISVIGLCDNMFTTSILETGYFPLRILFNTDDTVYSMSMIDSDEGLWLKDSNFLIYNKSTGEKILGLSKISEKQEMLEL